MANKILYHIEDLLTPFSEMSETTLDASYEAPYSYEPDDEMLEALAKRFEFDMWVNQFPRES